MYSVLLISLVNDDFQITKCTIILHTDERICYALSILSIIYLPSVLLKRYLSKLISFSRNHKNIFLH